MSDVVLEVRAELDVPGETGRQARVFALWCASLLLAVVVSAYRRPTVPEKARGTDEQQQILSNFKRERFTIALALGFVFPGLGTLLLTHRHRRGGEHARGIIVDVTEDGQLRLWGRGYGQRVLLEGAELQERLVDLYSGRMGSWRERRLSIRARKVLPGSPSSLELGTLAETSDERLGLSLVGGEGDCVELTRADFLAIREHVRQFALAGQAATESTT
ncbi:MAG: hypothetical protein FJ096_17865 [Deltaproteobacteria bacterium]|nr:hypothetical protein [Deltaproteobacteria bacterium]